MPRLHGYRERLYGNYYDAVSILTMDDERNRLFNRLFNKNIGTKHLTNLFVAGRLHGDQTFVLSNVYTRTNLAKPRPVLDDAKHNEVRDLFVDGHDGDAIGTLLRDLQWERSPLARALEEWAHVATVTVVVGDKPMFEMSFHDLMDGPAFGPGRHNDNPDLVLPWRKRLAIPIIVPVRQNFSAVIEAPSAPTQSLRRLATKAGVLPEPLLWVHLEGLMTRDVC